MDTTATTLDGAGTTLDGGRTTLFQQDVPLFAARS
jgi:hypothetical protein